MKLHHGPAQADGAIKLSCRNVKAAVAVQTVHREEHRASCTRAAHGVVMRVDSEDFAVSVEYAQFAQVIRRNAADLHRVKHLPIRLGISRPEMKMPRRAFKGA